MPLSDSDISWQMLRRIVHDWAGMSAELTEVQRLEGGCVNTTVRLTLKDGAKAVLKISPHRVNRHYLTEAYQLNVLRHIGLPVPQVFCAKVDTMEDQFSYLLMEHLPGIDMNEARHQIAPEQYDHIQMHLADLVVTMHNQTHETYTRLTEGHREEFKSWPEFYRKVYDHHWHECEKDPQLPGRLRKSINRIHERLDSLVAHEDCPRLLHYDVWHANILCHPDAHGKWWVTGLLDPNCKYGHAEAEIAYMDLFHTITPAFLRAYQQTHKLSPEYHRVRKHVYQIYELVNHVNVFGHEYLKPLAVEVEKLNGLV